MQHTLDRAVLAAADLDQEREAQQVVEDYFDKAGLTSALKNVDVDQGLNYKTIAVEAEVTTTAPYLDILYRWVKTGQNIEALSLTEEELDAYRFRLKDPYATELEIYRLAEAERDLAAAAAPQTNTITSSATGAAEERVSNVEIAMVLDVSGSMGSNNRMPRLKTAANEFIDTVLQDDTEDLVSVSIVPYDEGVSLGSGFYNSTGVSSVRPATMTAFRFSARTTPS